MAKTSKSKTKRVTGKRTAAKGKGVTIIEMLRRKEGATLTDLTKASTEPLLRPAVDHSKRDSPVNVQNVNQTNGRLREHAQ